MRILHTADLHLGRMLYGRSLLDDQRYFIEQVLLPAVKRERTDLVVIAGDIFDRQVAPGDAIALFDRLVTMLTQDAKVPVVACAGNHDSAQRLSFGQALLKSGGLYLYTSLAQACAPARFEDEYGPVEVYALPHFDLFSARDALGDNTVASLGDAYRRLAGAMRAQFDPAARHVLLAHCFVSGAKKPDGTLYVGDSAQISADVFDGFDYVALGHLHGPQPVGRSAVRYSGSPLAYSFDECGQKKGLTLVELEAPGGAPAVTQLPVQPLHGVRILTGKFDELCAAAKEDAQADDYLYVQLTDPAPVFEPVARLREFYPNLLGLSLAFFDRALDEGRQVLSDKVAKGVDDTALFTAFLDQVCGVKAEDADVALFEAAAKAARGEEAAQ